ncbi:IZH family channel protein [Mycena indigotica]|uniref:IZH family channel protein n=1 Tax=Mycena indigotica TaxID=2126181 RepID=A0A8H6VWP3_9AGAR|nr:IZH family channel protein [Mycena indigotica]KAF7294676.1 IZH family channel protein [Mycena indigotica]
MSTESIATMRPRLNRRRMSAPPPRPSPTRLPQCRPLSLSLEALDLCSASPAQILASLRLLILSCLAELERRLAGMEKAGTALEMLRSIQAEVRSHLPDVDLGLAARLPDLDDLKSHLPDIDKLKSLISGLDFSTPLSYVPTLSQHLRHLHDHIADTFDFEFTRPHFDFEFRRPKFDFELRKPSFEFSRPSFDFEFTDLRFDLPILADLADVLDAFRADVDAFLADIPQLPSFPTSLSFPSLPTSLSRASSSTVSSPLPESSDEEKSDIARALALSAHGRNLIGYDDLPVAWRNNPFVQGGYRFIPLSKWPNLVTSVFCFHNETLNIHTHFIPLLLWSSAFAGMWVAPGWSSTLDRIISSIASILAPLVWLFPKWSTSDIARYTPFSAYTASISSQSLPFSYFSSPYPPISPQTPPDPSENLFTLFALACLACSVLWHTMAGCARRGPMETCARIDYVGIGWLTATSIATVVHYGYACAEAAVEATPLGHKVLHPAEVLQQIQAHVTSHRSAMPAPTSIAWASQIEESLPEVLVSGLSSGLSVFSSVFSAIYGATLGQAEFLLAYHPFGAACLLLCFVCGVSGNILPFSEWFNRVENRLWRIGFFVGISCSALAPLAGIAALQGLDATLTFMAPVAPSLLFYIVGLVVYATQFPECLLGPDGSRGKNKVVRFLVDRCGAGSHAIWHVFIVFAIRAHRDGIREMRRAAAEGGCAAGVAGW